MKQKLMNLATKLFGEVDLTVLFLLVIFLVGVTASPDNPMPGLFGNETTGPPLPALAMPECYLDSDCDDDYAYTIDTCVDGACIRVEIECLEDSECADKDGCTVDLCVDYFCQNNYDAKIEGCCISDEDCLDGNPATNDICKSDGYCDHVYSSGGLLKAEYTGCTSDADCADDDKFTLEYCDAQGVCQYPVVYGSV